MIARLIKSDSARASIMPCSRAMTRTLPARHARSPAGRPGGGLNFPGRAEAGEARRPRTGDDLQRVRPPREENARREPTTAPPPRFSWRARRSSPGCMERLPFCRSCRRRPVATIDFRQVYQAVLESWLQLPAVTALSGGFSAPGYYSASWFVAPGKPAAGRPVTREAGMSRFTGECAHNSRLFGRHVTVGGRKWSPIQGRIHGRVQRRRYSPSRRVWGSDTARPDMFWAVSVPFRRRLPAR